MAKHGGKRTGSGRKLEPGRERSIQKPYSSQPLTHAKIEKLADKKGCSPGRILDDLVDVLINFEVNI